MNQPRKHHYVPKFLLGGFTDIGSTDGYLSVLDLKRSHSWRCKPEAVAHQRDFNRVETDEPTIDPFIVERALAQYEGHWSSRIREILTNKTIPKGEAREDLMLFIAFMMVRIPRFRSKVDAFLREAQELERLAEKYSREAQGLGDISPTENVGFEWTQTELVDLMIKSAHSIAPVVSQRSWQILSVKDGASDLICSDSPAILSWATPIVPNYPPGLLHTNAVVTVPIDKRAALIGSLYSQPELLLIGDKHVAQLNSATGMFAEQLYCPAEDFIWLTKDGTIGNRADLVAALSKSGGL